MRQVPVDGARQAGFEVVRRFPTQRCLGAGWVYLVTEVVAGAIGDEADQPLPRTGGVRHPVVQMGADGTHHLQVGTRLAAADRTPSS